MSILNWFAKASKPWQVSVNSSTSGGKLSEPFDRNSAIGFVLGSWEQGWEVLQIKYCGKPVLPRQFQDFISDAVLLKSVVRLSEEKGVSLEQCVTSLSPGDPSVKAAVGEAIEELATKLHLNSGDAAEILSLRIAKGLPAVFSQQTP